MLSLTIRNPDNSLISTIPLSDTPAILLSYDAASPAPRSVERSSPLRNGSVLGKTTRPDVTEAVRVLVVGDDATLLAHRHAIEQAFLIAEDRQERRAGPRVWAEFQMPRTAKVFRAEIKRGQLVGDNEDVDAWRTGTMPIDIQWLRTWYWEARDAIELPLRSAATAKTTGGVTINNSNNNWVEVLGADLPGVVDAPVELRITNTFANVGAPTILHVGHNRTAAPTALNPILEAEDATWYGTVANISNAAYSGGAGRQVQWSGTAETVLAQWALSGALLGQLNGAWVQVWGKFPTLPVNVNLRLELRYLSVSVLAKPAPVWVASGAPSWQLLANLQLPPRTDLGTPQDLELRLYGEGPGGGTFTLNADYLQLLVVDGYQRYRANGYGLQQGVTLIDNPPDNDLRPLVFSREPGDKTILLRPGATQRLTILQSGGGNQIDRTASVRAFWRERRLTF